MNTVFGDFFLCLANLPVHQQERSEMEAAVLVMLYVVAYKLTTFF